MQEVERELFRRMQSRVKSSFRRSIQRLQGAGALRFPDVPQGTLPRLFPRYRLRRKIKYNCAGAGRGPGAFSR